MRNIKLTIEYDGTNYGGWQIQNNKNTVQKEVQNALTLVMNEPIELIGASRTDSGVHALGQVANFKTSSVIEISNITRALNSILPSDIVIKNAEEVEESFHSRFSATGKMYKYIIRNSKTPSALNRNFEHFYPYPLDIEKMQEAAIQLIGTHDFGAFKSSGSSVKDDVRTIYGAKLKKDDDNIEFYISGDGFLYNMVRIIVGTLLEIGNGKKEVSSMKDIILSKNRKLAGKTAPAKGLCLVEVYY